MKLKEEVQDRVASLLAMVCNNKTDEAMYDYVLATLTRMAILGTMPSGCGRAREDRQGEDIDDFSARKENFIAP